MTVAVIVDVGIHDLALGIIIGFARLRPVITWRVVRREVDPVIAGPGYPTQDSKLRVERVRGTVIAPQLDHSLVPSYPDIVGRNIQDRVNVWLRLSNYAFTTVSDVVYVQLEGVIRKPGTAVLERADEVRRTVVTAGVVQR